MKKTGALSMLAIMSATFTFAQSPLQTLQTTKPGKMLARQHAPLAAAKTTAANASRCIAETYAPAVSGSYVVNDSLTYAYTGTWGSYGSPMAYGAAPRAGLKFATGVEYLDGGSGFAPAFKATNSFDANRNITVQLVQQWNNITAIFDNTYQSLFTYDANNNNLTNIFQTWDTGVWTNNGKNTYTYSGHLVLSDLAQSWNTATATWDNSSLSTFHYNASNNQDTASYQTWNSSSSTWENSSRDYYIYNADGNLIEDNTQFWNVSGWVDAGKIVYSNFTGSNPLTSVTFQWDGSQFIKSDSAANTYNTYGQLTDSRTQTWDTVASAWSVSDNDADLRLYYEEYTTVVQNVVNAGGTSRVYPVPAANSLSVEVNWDLPQAFIISLYNAQGMVLRQVQVPAMARYKDDLQISDLPVGNYLLKIDGARGHLEQKVVIIR